MHHDASADRVARRLSASAFTIGNHIYFRSGSYAPATEAGRELIGHELVHVQQQSRTGPRLDRKIFTAEELEDMDPPSTQPRPELLGSDPAFEKFAATLRERYGAKSVRRGTFSDQAAEIASRQVTLAPGVQRGTLDKASWKDWSPPSGWATYRAILKGIESFAQAFGGLPELREVVLYDTEYDVDAATGLVQPSPGTGASYGAGQLTIYSGIVSTDPRPAGRSGTPYPGKEAELVSTTSERAAVRRNIAHEFGHGMAEMATGQSKQGPDPSMLDDYQRQAGWSSYRPATSTTPAVPPRLYDAGVPEVQDALRSGTQPPEQYHITKWNWNEGHWIEQPVTQYSTDNPGDDFAESIMAFVEFPDVLKARSPRRFAFIDARKSKWLPKPGPGAPAMPAQGGLGTLNTPPGGVAGHR